MKSASPGANVEAENWKLYKWLTRAAVGTCELNGKTIAGVANVLANSRLVKSSSFIPIIVRPKISGLRAVRLMSQVAWIESRFFAVSEHLRLLHARPCNPFETSIQNGHRGPP